MKKILSILAFLPALAFGQSYPSPTYNNVTINGTATIPHAAITGGTITGLSSPIPVASGGTNSAAASGTALDNITGFSGTGFLTRTGAGAYSFVANPLPVANGGTNATTALGATSNLQYQNAATGGVVRSVASKLSDIENVLDFNAKCDGSTDDSTAFQNAANALPAIGGKINVPQGTCVINTAPTWGTKNIFWNFTPATIITGSQTTFPRMQTNSFQTAAGPWIVSQSTMASPSQGGIGGFNVEMVQPSTYVGQSEAMYVGARGAGTNASSNVWALNTLVQADPGAAGVYHSIEADVNSNSAGGAYTVGVDVTGVGTSNASTALSVERGDTSKWVKGLWIQDALTGITYNAPTAQSGQQFINALQYANGQDMIVEQRATDTSPTGYYFRFVNNANSVNEAALDINGNLFLQGYLQTSTGILGTTSGANAGAGYVGQPLTNSASGVSMTSGTPVNVVSLSLTAGDWLVSGTVQFVPAGSTTVSSLLAAVSTTSGSVGAFQNWNNLILPFTTGVSQVLPTPILHVNVSTTTTVYLVGDPTFGTSTMTASGFIQAYRIH